MNPKRLIAIVLSLAALAAFTPAAILNATECRIGTVGRIEVGHDGLAGAFIGVVGDNLIVAGGSDFPAGKPWEGGRKVFYDDILEIVKNGDSYIGRPTGFKLPVPLASGVAVSDGKALYCFGGFNEHGQSGAVYAIKKTATGYSADSVAALPQSFKPAAALLYSGKIYVHGTGSGANRMFVFSPDRHSWKEISGCPDRMIEEGASFVAQHNGREDALYLIGGRGTDSDGLYISSTIWEYLPTHNQWVRKNDMAEDGKEISLMYSSAIPYGSAHILLIGGDDGIGFRRRTELGKEIDGAANETARDSLKTLLENSYLNHTGFNTKVYAYHTITNTLIPIAESDIALPVCTSAVPMNGEILLPSGEVRPGVRTDEIIGVSVSDPVSFGWLNYAVVILYLVAMMGVGFYFSKKAKNTDQFFKGGGKIPWWAAGISIFATALSAITFLSIPAKAYMADWGMFIFNMAILFIVPVVIHFYLPFFRKLNVASVYQYLEERFSSPVRYLASLFFCLFMFARVAIVLFLPSLALNAVTGLNVYVCILLMGIVTIIYCTMGGIEAVVWGDVIQGIILVGGAVISLVYLIVGTDGGLMGAVHIAIDDQKFNILDFSFDWTKPVFWVTVIGGLANQMLTYTSDQSVVQRYITVKDDSGTKKSLWLNGLLSVPVTFIFFSIGTGLYVFFKSHPDLLNVSMSNTDSIFPHFIMQELPAGCAGLLIAAIFAAAMSTLSANINSTSTVMTEDFYSKLKKNVNDSGKMRFARWTGIAIGGFGVGMAVLLATFDITSLWDQFNFFLGLLTSGLGGLFMMGIFTKRIGTRSALTGFAGSIVILLLCNSYSRVSVILYGAIGLVSCFIIGYLASFIFGYRK
jgi:solute:Na+ symporter, SSS family